MADRPGPAYQLPMGREEYINVSTGGSQRRKKMLTRPPRHRRGGPGGAAVLQPGGAAAGPAGGDGRGQRGHRPPQVLPVLLPLLEPLAREEMYGKLGELVQSTNDRFGEVVAQQAGGDTRREEGFQDLKEELEGVNGKIEEVSPPRVDFL